MFDRSLLSPMLTGQELYDAMRVFPEYDDTFRYKDKSVRLVALSDLYNIYMPSMMSEEIYSKIYLSLLRSLNKKEGIAAVQQINQNHRRIKGMSYQGIIGGSDSFTIIGCSGIGKSSAINRSVSLISDKTYIELNDTKICPAVVVQCPFDASVKGLAFEILRKIDSVLDTHYYNNAVRSHATIDVLIGIISQVAINHVGLLIIDEIQNVATSKNGKAFIRAITQLINSSGISICMVGTPECRLLFEKELQLARRSMGLYYTPLQYDEYFIDFCRIVFSYQYTRIKTEINAGILEWLYEHSGGLVSVVVSLLHDTQEIAILSGYEKIDLKSLAEAYEKRTAMLHGFLQKNTPSLSKTSRSTKISKQAILENEAVLEKVNTQEGYRINSLDFSLIDVIEEAKKNNYDVVEVIKQYIVVEQIREDECKIC